MQGEILRRSLLVVATLLCQFYFVCRVYELDLPLSANMFAKGGPVVLLGCIALLAPWPLPGQKEVLQAKAYADRIGFGLLLSSLGDVFLELDWGFVYGLGFFLLAHLCYAAAFKTDSSAGLVERRGKLALWQGRFAALIWFILLAVIYGHFSVTMEESLKIPVVAYIGAIGNMVYRAVGRFDPSCGDSSYWWSAFGSIVFALSDTLLAYNKFVEPVPIAGFMVMFLYYAGQIMLATSTIVDSHLDLILKSKTAETKGGQGKTAPKSPSTGSERKRNKKKKK